MSGESLAFFICRAAVKIKSVSILSKEGKILRLRLSVPMKILNAKNVKIKKPESDLLEFATTKGQRYELVSLEK